MEKGKVGGVVVVEVVWEEKGWEVSPPPDGSPLLANWQNHLPWHRHQAHLHDGPAEEAAEQCHRVKYETGQESRVEGDLCCFGSF